MVDVKKQPNDSQQNRRKARRGGPVFLPRRGMSETARRILERPLPSEILANSGHSTVR
jgi:hypothetical protein